MQLSRPNSIQLSEGSLYDAWRRRFAEMVPSDFTRPMDIYVVGDTLNLLMAFPGFSKDDITIRLSNTHLDITAEASNESEEKGRHYIFRESSRSYARRVELPPGVDTGHIEATFKDGQLKLSMGYKAPGNEKQIRIN